MLAEGAIREDQTETLVERTNALMEQRLAEVTRTAPALAAALRGYRRAAATGDTARSPRASWRGSPASPTSAPT